MPRPSPTEEWMTGEKLRNVTVSDVFNPYFFIDLALDFQNGIVYDIIAKYGNMTRNQMV